ncbi:MULTISPECIES: 6-bladed beta-propeller [Pedobacter]|uniref:6-bladed beta-propeller n=1 Tax=Pedobacter TaxID=84567 RepID=UPI00292CFA50|nr:MULTISPECIES: 6-bladed beta-propeller [Pedobacter]
MKRIIIIVACLFLISCKGGNHEDMGKEIKVDVAPENAIGNFDKYFDSSKVISLETSAASLIGNINRISIFDNRIYILDRATNSVFIFNWNGKFITKIHDIGVDKGKYIGIMDFAIDKASKRILVHTHRPYKLIYYNMEGKFLSETPLEGYYKNIDIPAKGKLLTINPTGSYTANVLDLNSGDKNEFIHKDAISEKFNFFSTVFPNVLNSLGTYVTVPYSPVIYKYSDDKIIPAYRINFGKKNMPDSLLDKNLPASDIYNEAMKNEYGFFISNFRETKNFLVFSYGKNSIVVYSKKDGKAESFSFIENKHDLIHFENLFGHDGNDDYILSTRQAIFFKSQMNVYKSSPKDWAKVPPYIKAIDSTLNNNSNPVLIVYKLK